MSAKPEIPKREIVCFGLARKLIDKPLEYHDPNYLPNSIFKNNFITTWVKHVEARTEEIFDARGTHCFTLGGWNGHIYRVGSNWCAVATNVEMSPISMQHLTSYLLHPANPLEAIAEQFQDLLAGEEIARMRHEVGEIKETMKNNMGKLIDRGDHLQVMLKKTEELKFEADRYYHETANLRREMGCPWWFPTSWIPSCNIL